MPDWVAPEETGLVKTAAAYGFVSGVTLGFFWVIFFVLGLHAGMSLRGQFRWQRLLVKYHDTLASLGALPADGNGQDKTAASED